MLKRLLVTVALAFALGAPAFAQETPAPAETAPPAEQAQPTRPALPEISIVTCPADQANAHEADDQALLNRVMTAFQAASFPGLRIYQRDLRAALDRAPDCYPLIERRGDTILVREDDMTKYITLGGAAALQVRGDTSQRITVTQGDNTYGQIALVLGSYANEMRQYRDSIRYLDRGLALQPRNQFLIMEKVTALLASHRQAEAYPILRNALDDPELSLTLDRSRYLRNLGVVLIDLERLDEAEASLNESITLQPNNPIARQELEYIAQLRAGGRTRDTGITAPNAPHPETQ